MTASIKRAFEYGSAVGVTCLAIVVADRLPGISRKVYVGSKLDSRSIGNNVIVKLFGKRHELFGIRYQI